MKKLILKSVSVSLLTFISQMAMAVESQVSQPFTSEQIDFLKKELNKKDFAENTVSFYGLMQINANTSDTQRSNVPDFAGQHVRLGTKVSGGIASGQIEVEFVGNQQSGQATSIDPVSGTSITSTPSNNGVILRQAQLNLDVWDIKKGSNNYLTTVSLGGVRIGGAVYTTPDISNAPSQYSRQDGAYLQEKLEMGNEFNIIIGLGAFDTLFGASPGNRRYLGWGNNTSYLSQPSLWGNPSLNRSLAYVGSLSVTYNLDSNRTINGAFYYGAQKNAPSLMNGDGTVVNTRDANHTEASVFYNDVKIFGSKGVISANGVSFWYEREANGRSKLASNSSIGMVEDSEVAALYGLSAAADSSPYLSGMLQKGDRLTYAAAYSIVTNDFANETRQTYISGTPPVSTAYTNQNFKLYQIAASLGYAVSTFEVALNVERSSSDSSIFTDSNGVAQKSEMKSYITAAYVF